MKKASLILLAIIMVLSLTACGGGGNSTSGGDTAPAASTGDSGASVAAPVEGALPADGPAFLYTMGHGAAEGSIGDLYCLKFKELVEAKSGGKITVNVYAGSQLGTYGEMLQNLQTNDIQGMIFQPAPAVSFVPELALLDLPYAFLGKTADQIDTVLNSSAYTALLDASFESSGYKRMSFAQAATFRETTSNKELRTAEDFQGLNIRTLENKYHIAFWQAVGANPTPVAFGELYLSLQQGLVDAQENPYDTAAAANFQEVQSYVVNTHHILYPNLFLVNQEYYESMPAEYQEVFDEAHVEAKVYAEQLMAESASTELQKLLDGGMTLIDLDDAELQKMVAAAAGVEAMIRADLGDEIVDSFLASLS